MLRQPAGGPEPLLAVSVDVPPRFGCRGRARLAGCDVELEAIASLGFRGGCMDVAPVLSSAGEGAIPTRLLVRGSAPAAPGTDRLRLRWFRPQSGLVSHLPPKLSEEKNLIHHLFFLGCSSPTAGDGGRQPLARPSRGRHPARSRWTPVRPRPRGRDGNLHLAATCGRLHRSVRVEFDIAACDLPPPPTPGRNVNAGPLNSTRPTHTQPRSHCVCTRRTGRLPIRARGWPCNMAHTILQVEHSDSVGLCGARAGVPHRVGSRFRWTRGDVGGLADSSAQAVVASTRSPGEMSS